MKNLNKVLVVVTALFAAGLAAATWWGKLETVHSQVGIFVLAGLFALYCKEEDLLWLDLILLPLATAVVFSQGLISVCIDFAIFYYIIYRFGPKTEEGSLLGLMLLLPLLMISKLSKILPEEFIVGSSWMILVFICINWPIQKFEYKNSKNWLEWFYCLLVITTYIDNQLFGFVNAQYGLVLLAILALISRLPKVAMLLGLLTAHSLGAFDSHVAVSIFSFIWFDVYGVLLLLILSPFFTKQPSVELPGIITYYLGLVVVYASMTEVFLKNKYKESWQAWAIWFLLLISLYETSTHWNGLQNIESQNWWSMLPGLSAFLVSYLALSSKVGPLKIKLNISDVLFDLWKKRTPAEVHANNYSEFQKEGEVAATKHESMVMAIVVGFTVATLGFLWLASVV